MTSSTDLPPPADPAAPLRLLVIGASRGIGARTVAAALARGHAVRALARDPAALAAEGPGLERVAADARDGRALAAALEGMDAAIYAVGTPAGARGPFGPPVTLHSEATAALLAAMEAGADAGGTRRLIAVTGYGAGDSRAAMSAPERIAHRALLGRPYADKDWQEAMIRASALDWTLVRPTILRDGPARGTYQVLRRPQDWRNGLIARADVADFLVRCAETGGFLREAPVISW